MHPTWKYYQRNAGKIKIPPVKIFKNSARKTKFFAGEKKVKYRIISCEKVKKPKNVVVKNFPREKFYTRPKKTFTPTFKYRSQKKNTPPLPSPYTQLKIIIVETPISAAKIYEKYPWAIFFAQKANCIPRKCSILFDICQWKKFTAAKNYKNAPKVCKIIFLLAQISENYPP